MFDLISLIKTAGYLGVFAIIFAECGLLVGFFLPGDSLLFTAGFLSSQGFLHIWILLPLVFIAAIVGDNTGYFIGTKLGPRIFTKKDSLFFRQENARKANAFFEKHGGKAIILARFVPVIRTFSPVMAGVGQMKYHIFFLYDLVGGSLWAIGLTLAGYYLGQTIPNVDRYLLPIVAVIILISVLPGIIHLLRDPQFRKQIISYIKK